jgi:hypothetical protein
MWIALILATALTLQVLANCVLSAGLALYVLCRSRCRHDSGFALGTRGQHRLAASTFRFTSRIGDASRPCTECCG